MVPRKSIVGEFASNGFNNPINVRGVISMARAV